MLLYNLVNHFYIGQLHPALTCFFAFHVPSLLPGVAFSPSSSEKAPTPPSRATKTAYLPLTLCRNYLFILLSSPLYRVAHGDRD